MPKKPGPRYFPLPLLPRLQIIESDRKLPHNHSDTLIIWTFFRPHGEARGLLRPPLRNGQGKALLSPSGEFVPLKKLFRSSLLLNGSLDQVPTPRAYPVSGWVALSSKTQKAEMEYTSSSTSQHPPSRMIRLRANTNSKGSNWKEKVHSKSRIRFRFSYFSFGKQWRILHPSTAPIWLEPWWMRPPAAGTSTNSTPSCSTDSKTESEASTALTATSGLGSPCFAGTSKILICQP